MALLPHIPTVQGTLQVIRRMKRKDQQFARDVARGLKKGGLYLQRTSQKRAPVEFGVLKNSAFTRAFGSGFQTVVVVGYTAAYAGQVHERVAMKLKGRPRRPSPPHKGRYWDPIPRATAKFLEKPVREEKEKISEIVRNTAAGSASLFFSL
jgi:hypothetical protein